MLTGWRGLALVFALFLGNAEAQVLSTRIWPARDYTRLTLESKGEIQYTVFNLKGPERLVLDLETAELSPALAELSGRVNADDPYIKGLRVARNRPGVIRLVLDLKAEVKPQIFNLPPIADYGHRLVLDIHPLVAVDPVALLIEESQKRPQSPAKPSESRFATIVIDAGHGGEDPGAIGRGGSREKDITLDITRRLKKLVDADPNMRALLTRDGDYFLPLGARVEKARAVKADLLVSIHADAFKRPNVRGSSVFALSDRRATSEMARILANKENESDLIGGVALTKKDDHVKRTIVDLSQTATIDHSLRLGNSVLRRLGAVNDLHKPNVEQASFAVLTAHDVPSILVETAFISNPEEERRLNDEAYQDKLARAILDGIREYVAKHPPRPQGPSARRPLVRQAALSVSR
ncbi:MAG TPA: N-acetylmuramoyl-L-alanine amidase [Burkholderiales bacterium]|nr:N-acetylmuramoyl-L-alanine amidase [Burkholderiales bacterium]